MQKFKKFWNLLVILLGAPVLLIAAYSFQRYVVSGTEIYELQSDGSLEISGTCTVQDGLVSSGPVTGVGPFKRGSSPTGTSVTMPTLATASNFATWVPVTNIGSTTVSIGTLLIASNTGLGYVWASPALTDQNNILGVAAESIAAAAKGWMVPRGGGYATIRTTGTVAIGDVLVASGTYASVGITDNSPADAMEFAIALSCGSASQNSVIGLMR